MVLWQKHLNLSLLPLSDVEIELQHVFLFIICTYLPKHAEIAQLGELSTEDLKVFGSIPGFSSGVLSLGSPDLES